MFYDFIYKKIFKKNLRKFEELIEGILSRIYSWEIFSGYTTLYHVYLLLLDRIEGCKLQYLYTFLYYNTEDISSFKKWHLFILTLLVCNAAAIVNTQQSVTFSSKKKKEKKKSVTVYATSNIKYLFGSLKQKHKCR